MENAFLILSNWWGLSDKPGSQKMFINADGSYVIKVEFSHPRDQVENSQKEGNIDKERLKQILEFAEINITQPTNHMIYDAGWAIEYIKESKTIKVVNDLDLWKRLIELVPEYKIWSLMV